MTDLPMPTDPDGRSLVESGGAVLVCTRVDELPATLVVGGDGKVRDKIEACELCEAHVWVIPEQYLAIVDAGAFVIIWCSVCARSHGWEPRRRTRAERRRRDN